MKLKLWIPKGYLGGKNVNFKDCKIWILRSLLEIPNCDMNCSRMWFTRSGSCGHGHASVPRNWQPIMFSPTCLQLSSECLQIFLYKILINSNPDFMLFSLILPLICCKNCTCCCFGYISVRGHKKAAL